MSENPEIRFDGVVILFGIYMANYIMFLETIKIPLPPSTIFGIPSYILDVVNLILDVVFLTPYKMAVLFPQPLNFIYIFVVLILTIYTIITFVIPVIKSIQGLFGNVGDVLTKLLGFLLG